MFRPVVCVFLFDPLMESQSMLADCNPSSWFSYLERSPSVFPQRPSVVQANFTITSCPLSPPPPPPTNFESSAFANNNNSLSFEPSQLISHINLAPQPSLFHSDKFDYRMPCSFDHRRFSSNAVLSPVINDIHQHVSRPTVLSQCGDVKKELDDELHHLYSTAAPHPAIFSDRWENDIASLPYFPSYPFRHSEPRLKPEKHDEDFLFPTPPTTTTGSPIMQTPRTPVSMTPIHMDNDLGSRNNSKRFPNTDKDNHCQVCLMTQANGLHFGARTCAACAAFFRRTVSDDKKYTCKRSHRCTSAARDGTGYRKICRSCRMKRCLEIGMLPENVQQKRSVQVISAPPVVSMAQQQHVVDLPSPSSFHMNSDIVTSMPNHVFSTKELYSSLSGTQLS